MQEIPRQGIRTTSHRIVPRGGSRRGATDHAPVGQAGQRPATRRTGGAIRTLTGSEDGFTLVELLVVVLMLVTLLGIAVPTFINQRDNAFDAAVRSDLRSAAIALESYRAQNSVYADAAVTGTGWGYVRSPDVVSVANVTVAGDDYCVVGWYEPEDSEDRVEDPSTVAADRAEWAITPGGMVSLADVAAAPATCP